MAAAYVVLSDNMSRLHFWCCNLWCSKDFDCWTNIALHITIPDMDCTDQNSTKHLLNFCIKTALKEKMSRM